MRTAKSRPSEVATEAATYCDSEVREAAEAAELVIEMLLGSRRNRRK